MFYKPKQTKQSAMAFAMLLAFVVPFVLTGCFWWQLRVVKYEMKERLEKEKMVQVVVDPSTLVWVKPGKECWIGHQMFDVKFSEQSGDMLVLHGLYDEQEKAIKLGYNKYLKSNQTDKKTFHSLGILFYFGNSLEPDKTVRIIPPGITEIGPISGIQYNYPAGFRQAPELPPLTNCI